MATFAASQQSCLVFDLSARGMALSSGTTFAIAFLLKLDGPNERVRIYILKGLLIMRAYTCHAHH